MKKQNLSNIPADAAARREAPPEARPHARPAIPHLRPTPQGLLCTFETISANGPKHRLAHVFTHGLHIVVVDRYCLGIAVDFVRIVVGHLVLYAKFNGSLRGRGRRLASLRFAGFATLFTHLRTKALKVVSRSLFAVRRIEILGFNLQICGGSPRLML